MDISKLFIKSYIITLFFVISPLRGQNIPNNSVPIDTAYVERILDNGIRYIIKKNDLTKNKAYFEIFFNVGAFQEEVNEYGITHFIEHLSFYEANKYFDYFKSKGLSIGKDINAGTSFEHTKFDLFNLTLEKEVILDSAIMFLKEWAFNFNFNPSTENILRERKIITEEWKREVNLCSNLNCPIEFKNSIYTRINTLGDTSTINNFTTEQLKKYRQKWYRPDHMTIIAIGDFDVSMVEQKISGIFRKIPPMMNKSPRKNYTIPDNNDPVITITSDPEAKFKTNRIEINFKQKHDYQFDMSELKNEYLDRLIERMLRNRLDEIANSSNPPFQSARATYSDFYLNTVSNDNFSINIRTKNDIKTALRSVFTEIRRINLNGFTESELIRVKDGILRFCNNGQTEVKLPYDECLVQIFYYILKGRIPVSQKFLCNFLNNTIPLVTTEEINSRFIKYTKNVYPIITVKFANQETNNQFIPLDIKFMIDSINLITVEPYIDKSIMVALPKENITPGKVISELKNNEINTTEWTLNNGMHIIIKQTGFNENNVQFIGLRRKPFLFNKEYLSTLNYGGYALNEMGIGEIPFNQLKHIFLEKNISFNTILNSEKQGLTGSTNPQNLETTLQLINVFFTRQKFDENVLRRKIDFFQSFIQSLSPSRALSDTVYKYTNNNYQDSSYINLKTVSLEKLIHIYQKIYGSPEKFTFIFVGNLDLEVSKTLIEKYLGSLKKIPLDEKKDTVNIKRSKESPWWNTGRCSYSFKYPMKNPNAFIYIGCQGSYKTNQLNTFYKEITNELLIKQCQNLIRNKLAGSYSIGHFTSYVDERNFLQTTIYFGTDSSKSIMLKNTTLRELEKFMKKGPDEIEFLKLRNNIINKCKENLQTNDWWANVALHEYYFNNQNIISNHIADAEKISLKDFVKFSKNIYNQGNIVDIVMLPK